MKIRKKDYTFSFDFLKNRCRYLREFIFVEFKWIHRDGAPLQRRIFSSLLINQIVRFISHPINLSPFERTVRISKDNSYNTNSFASEQYLSSKLDKKMIKEGRDLSPPPSSPPLLEDAKERFSR